MTTPRIFGFPCRAIVWMALLVAGFGTAVENSVAADPGSTTFTSLRQLREALGQERRKVCTFQLDGIVRAADAANDVLFLQDDSEAAMIELDWGGATLQPGRHVLLLGTNCAVGQADGGLRIGRMPVVDEDGSHPPVTDSGAVYLRAGQNPIKVKWFNDVMGASLEVQYKWQDQRRQKIPNSALSRAGTDVASGQTNLLRGLNYRCFEGYWNRLPDFDQLVPVKSGVVKNFDVNIRSRPEHVGVEYTGWLAVPADGFYTFYLTSDDGGQLFLPESPPQLTALDLVPLPPPRQVAISEDLSPDEEDQWSQVEGDLNFIGARSGPPELELSYGDSRMRLKMVNSREQPAVYLLHSHVQAAGVCQGTYSAVGSTLANTLVVPDWQNLRVTDVAREFWKAFPSVNLGDPRLAGAPAVCVHGKIVVPEEGLPMLEDATGRMPVELLMPLPDTEGEPVEVLGKPELDGTNLVLRQAIYRPQSEADLTAADTNVVLTTAAQVQRLNREQAQQSYRVRLKGVVTFVSPNFASLVIEDSTRAIFLTHYASGWEHGVPRVGDDWEIEGVSQPADFSPVVQVQRAVRLGPGRLPAPVRPTWDQLINGSLDAQYVELQGIVTAVNSNSVALLTRMGKINVMLMGFPPEKLPVFENALVSIRGCLFAEWDRDTHRVKVQSGIQIGNPSLSVDEPAPVNPFDAERKTAAELLYFDPRASAFQRVSVVGQVLYDRDNTFFMTDGTNGVRFLPKEKFAAKAGDLVEVVGLPQLGGPSPVLREAVARTTGSAPLPEPRHLPVANLIQDDCDATLVRVEALLVSVREGQSEAMLEMQAGLRTFVARVASPDASIHDLKTGSRLELTGVYDGLGGDRVEGRDISSFELLLDSPAHIRVLAQSPWWKLTRLLVLVGILVGLIAAGTVWINLLRQQVGRRTAQLSAANRSLEAEIAERKRTENELVQTRLQHLVELERTRIARDIHDELGSTLSQIRLLSEMTLANNGAPPEIQSNSGKISAKALEATHVLDEIVWAVDPQNDTLESLLSYLFSYASDYLSLAGVRFRIDAPTQIPHHALTTQVRHQLYMAFKETLTNIVNHARATEVWVRLRLEAGSACFVVEDNGLGFDFAGRDRQAPGASGLENMRQRFTEIGGDFVYESEPNKGTRVKFVLPLVPGKKS